MWPVLAMLAGSAALKLFGAGKQAKASKDAARIQQQSAQEAMALNRMLYGDAQRMTQPWREGGQNAYLQLAQMLGVPAAEPGRWPAIPPRDYTGPQPRPGSAPPYYGWGSEPPPLTEGPPMDGPPQRRPPTRQQAGLPLGYMSDPGMRGGFIDPRQYGRTPNPLVMY